MVFQELVSPMRESFLEALRKLDEVFWYQVASNPNKVAMDVIKLPRRFWFIRVDCIHWQSPTDQVDLVHHISKTYLMRDDDILDVTGFAVFEVPRE